MSGIQQEWADFHRHAERHDVVFYYVGYFSQAIIAAMAEAVKLRAENCGAEAQTRRKLFSSFIEMTQNIVHYSTDLHQRDGQATTPSMRHGSVLISFSNGVYQLHCANRVDSEVAEKLRTRLSHLRSLTMEEIKAEYRHTLRSETPADSKGAGLGFLTVARDASAPLDFEFSPPCPAGISTFFLRATI